MKVNDSNLYGPGGVGSAGAAKPVQGGRTGSAGLREGGGSGDGVELSALAQGLHSMEAESPERQARVESLARAYAEGRYQPDPAGAAGGVIDDALKHR